MTSTKILRRLGVAVGSLALSFGALGNATAQESAESLDTSTTASTQYTPGAGFRLTEEIILHPRLELEGGYQNNVFYEDDSEVPLGSPLMRVGIGADINTKQRSAEEIASARVALEGDFQLTWHQYITDSDAASAQSDLGIDAFASVTFNPDGKVSFELRDGFTRSINPPPTETERELDRDRNELVAELTFRPGGGALAIFANAAWIVDIFEETSAEFANRSSVIGTIGAKWQWLPKTQVKGEVSYGIVSTDSPVKPGGSSTPLRITVGTSTLITPNFGTVLRAGYGNGFYEGANYSSFLALAELRYAIGPTIRLAGGYSRDFADSLIGNFRADDTLYARFSAQLGGRVLIGGKAEVRFREYDGLPVTGSTIFCENVMCPASASPTRDDLLFAANAHLDFQANQWLVFGGHFTHYSVNTDAVTLTTGSTRPDTVGYVWNEFMLKATAKF